MNERFIELWNTNETRLRRLTTETTVLRNGRPFDPSQYVTLVNLLNTYPAATAWNLTVAQFAQLMGGPLQMGKRAQIQSKIVERGNPDLAMSIANRNKVMLLALEAVLTSASVVRGAAGLSGLGVVPAVAIGTGSVAIISISVLALGALYAAVVSLGLVLSTAATYCVAAGCSIAEVAEVTNAMADAAVRVLSANPLNNLTNQDSGLNDLVFWGGMLVLGSGIAYAIWKMQGEPVPAKLQRAFAGIGEGYEPDTKRLRDLMAEDPSEEDYIDTAQWDNMFADDKKVATESVLEPAPRKNALVAREPLKFAKNAPARNASVNPPARNASVNAPARNASVNASANSKNKPRKGARLVATLPSGESQTQAKYRAWEIACRARKIQKSTCSPLQEEQVQEIQTKVILDDLSAAELDRVAKALRGGGYSVKVEK